MLRYRLASAILLIPLIVGSVVLGGLAFFILVSFALLVAGYELFQMARRAGYCANAFLGLALIALFLADAFWSTGASTLILTVGMMVSLVVAIFRRADRWILGWGLTITGAIYIGLLGSHFLLMRALPDGAIWTAVVLLGAWGTDTFAYVAGMRWGRHGFFTSISPKKTWEGAIGGEIACFIAISVLGTLAGLAPWHAAALGLLVGIAGTLGDLAESVIKRQLGAKDSGAIVPGHGGLLDRVDSLLFAAVVAYYYLALVARV